MHDEREGGEVVPLTDEDVADIAEAQQIVEINRGSQDARVRTANAYLSTLTRILLSHGFDPMRGHAMKWANDMPLELRGFRLE